MTNYDDQEEECDCIVCEMTQEFRSLVSDDVDWESSLRHVLHVTISKTETIVDEDLSEMVDEIYSEGFEEGILFGIEQMQQAMDNVVDEIKDNVYEVRDRREYPEDYASEIEVDKPVEKLEDLSDDQFDEIQAIIKRSL